MHLSARPPAGADITFLGHSTVLLEFDGGPRLLTDPVLRGRVGPLRRYGGSPAANPAPVDGVLISHGHHDHLDFPSLAALRDAGEHPRLVVPAGLGDAVRRRGYLRVLEVLPGDRLRIGDATIRVVHAEHDGTRRPFGPKASAVGYVVEASVSVYFAGDTGLFPGMADLAGKVDVALLPVWGWGPRLGPGHLNPIGAAAAAKLVEAPIAIPIHWGTYFPLGLGRVWPGRLRDPGHAFARQARAAIPTLDVRVLLPGERTRVSCPDEDREEQLLEAAL